MSGWNKRVIIHATGDDFDELAEAAKVAVALNDKPENRGLVGMRVNGKFYSVAINKASLTVRRIVNGE